MSSQSASSFTARTRRLVRPRSLPNDLRNSICRLPRSKQFGGKMRCSCSRDSRHKTGSEVQHPCGASMAAVAEALERTQVSLDFKAVHRKEQPDFESEAGAGERARTFARRLGDSLCELARR